MIQVNSHPNSVLSNILSSSLADAAAVDFTNVKWPNNPFHKGEVALQQLDGSQDSVMSYAPQFIRPALPEQHRAFYADLPFLVAAVRDRTGALWATLLEHPTQERVASSPDDPTTLVLHAAPVPGDALFDTFAFAPDAEGSVDIGLLGIQFETARRNRVNGRFTISPKTGDVVVHVDQSFGNCPQYIKPRPSWEHTGLSSPVAKTSTTPSVRSTRLSPAQVQWIERAETLFTATGYRPDDGTDDVRYGNDASHRGGPPGFVQGSPDGSQVVWTEFPGNRHFNTLGNLLLDPRLGLCFPNFATGGLLQLTGTAVVDFGALDQGGRQVRMQVTAVQELPAGSLPVRWKEAEGLTRMRVIKIEEESPQVKSFYIAPIEAARTLTTFRAGQHLPVQLTLPNGELIQRSYSLSSGPSTKDYYRISVKHHAQGKASSFLHKHMEVGDYISVGKPGGDFVLDHNPSPSDLLASNEKNTIVMISAGIGLTPFLSMVRDMAERKQTSGPVYWFHGVRNGRDHALRQEIEYWSAQLLPTLQRVTVYSRPEPTERSFDVEGRITAALVQERVAPEHWSHPVMRVYLCGPPSFVADLQDGLEERGVSGKNIFYESF
jgi:uncharacterized protein